MLPMPMMMVNCTIKTLPCRGFGKRPPAARKSKGKLWRGHFQCFIKTLKM
jgi:hypothetical protein